MCFRMNAVVVTVALATFTSTAQADVLHVDDDADLGGSGSSWDMAYRFVQDALAITEAEADVGETPPQEAGCPEIVNVEGWPIFDEDQGLLFGLNSFVVGDIGDISVGNEAMALTVFPGGFNVWSRDGMELFVHPIDTGSVHQNTPSLGDLDGDGILEVVVENLGAGM